MKLNINNQESELTERERLIYDAGYNDGQKAKPYWPVILYSVLGTAFILLILNHFL